jgi:hypothetical protein
MNRAAVKDTHTQDFFLKKSKVTAEKIWMSGRTTAVLKRKSQTLWITGHQGIDRRFIQFSIFTLTTTMKRN